MSFTDHARHGRDFLMKWIAANRFAAGIILGIISCFLVSLAVNRFQNPASAQKLSDTSANASALVDAYLRLHFPVSGEVMYREKLSRPILIPAPKLRPYLPNTAFYRATLWTVYFEYPRLEVLIAMSNTSTLSLTCLHSPSFGNELERLESFFDIFRGITAKTMGERPQVALAIGELMADFFRAEQASVSSEDASSVTVGIGRGDRLWQQVIVSYGANDKIESVKLVDPWKGSHT